MYELEVRARFRIGHRLVGSYQGRCNNVHGEGITAIFVFQSKTLNKDDMVADFGVVKNIIKGFVDEYFDHAYVYNVLEDDPVGKYLKDSGHRVFPINGNPTSELIARYLHQEVQERLLPELDLVKVGVVESFEDSVAWYVKE